MTTTPIASLLVITSETAALLLAVAVILKDWRSLAHRTFGIGIGLMAVEQALRAVAQSAEPPVVLYWQEWRMVVSALLPGTWLLFSLSFARANYRDLLPRWKWITAATYAVPLILVAGFKDRLFSDLPLDILPFGTAITPVALPLGWAGTAFHVWIVFSTALILVNLENTFRASTGRIRWQIKFVVLGLGMLCAVWVYTSSQALLYHSLDNSTALLNPIALLAASVLFTWAMFRSQFLNVDVYLSYTTIHYSVTVLLVGVYLVMVGLMTKLIHRFSPDRSVPLGAFFVLLALTGLGVLLMSDRLQERLKRFVTRQFKRPRYDYRKAWMELTERTTSPADVADLCTATAKIVSTTFNVLSVNIWLFGEADQRLTLAGSTVFTQSQAEELERSGDMVREFVLALTQAQPAMLDFRNERLAWAEEMTRAHPDFYAEYGFCYALPVEAGSRVLGIITLNEDRVGGAPFSIEDQDLLRAYAAHLAAHILQLQASESLRRAQELEAFQHVSAFFVHDLKNLASRLSLTMQNLPVHFENPEFRADALRGISQSVAKIENMCGRLSMLRKKVEIVAVPGDLNALVATTLDEMDLPVARDLQPLPEAPFDAEQIQKVITNLVLNAHEAVAGRGSVSVATRAHETSIEFSVTDNGCGLSREFIEKSLFRPFQSTKQRGLGIGLFHCRIIVEGHQGRIDVLSEEGKGSTFRVLLPLTLRTPVNIDRMQRVVRNG
jgi:putative PEP-CTERM system histidine kinase